MFAQARRSRACDNPRQATSQAGALVELMTGWPPMRTQALVIIVLTFPAVAQMARAELTAVWRHNPITPQAIASDPALAGMQSWSLMAGDTTGRWASVGLRGSLPQGLHFYNVPTSLGGGLFHPTAPAIALHPALAYDTYVSAPLNQTGSSAPALLGPFPENDPPMSFGGPSDAAPGRFSVAWGDPSGRQHPPETFEFARWTFPLGALPTIHPASVVWYSLPDRMVLVPTTLPEPATTHAVMIVVASAAWWRRRPGR